MAAAIDKKVDEHLAAKEKDKKAMAASIDKEVDEHLNAKEKEKEKQLSSDESIRNYIMSLIGTAPATTTPTVHFQETIVAPSLKPLAATMAHAKVTLQSSMKKAKN